MPDELPAIPTTPPALAPSPATSTEPKKTRAPRRSKEEIAADLAAKKNAKGGLTRKEETPAVPAATPVAKSVAKTTKPQSAPKAAAKIVQKSPVAVAAPSDDFADLMQLEAENQKLRKSLAEKLRAENADLRKKLGLN